MRQGCSVVWQSHDDDSRVLRELILTACSGRLRYRAVVGLVGVAVQLCSSVREVQLFRSTQSRRMEEWRCSPVHSYPRR